MASFNDCIRDGCQLKKAGGKSCYTGGCVLQKVERFPDSKAASGYTHIPVETTPQSGKEWDYRKNDPQGKKEEDMSIARWCDAGDHAFSGRDPEASKETKEFKRPYVERGKTLYEVEEVEMDVCGPCNKIKESAWQRFQQEAHIKALEAEVLPNTGEVQ